MLKFKQMLVGIYQLFRKVSLVLLRLRKRPAGPPDPVIYSVVTTHCGSAPEEPVGTDGTLGTPESNSDAHAEEPEEQDGTLGTPESNSDAHAHNKELPPAAPKPRRTRVKKIVEPEISEMSKRLKQRIATGQSKIWKTPEREKPEKVKRTRIKPVKTRETKPPKSKVAHDAVSRVTIVACETPPENAPALPTKRKGLTKALLEKALEDIAYFPKGLKYPCFDLTLYGDVGGDNLLCETDKDQLDGYWIDGWLDCLTRPLNWAVLQHPDAADDPEGWRHGHGQYIRHVPVKELRGRSLTFRTWEQREIGRRTSYDPNCEQKYAQPFDRPFNARCDAFRWEWYGDGECARQYGKRTFDIMVDANTAYAVNHHGRVLDLRESFRGERDSQDPQEVVRNRVRMAVGMQFNSEYLWRVVLQFDDHRPRLSFSASNNMVRALLKMRTSTDKQKRQRIIHLVGKHQRIIKDSAVCNVMKHYRGSIETLWQGCRMEIVPPVNETDSMEKFTNKIQEVRAVTAKIQPERLKACV